MKRARIGILGGTFDPPQMGHLILAEYSRETLQIDHILFVPVADHPVKLGEMRLPIKHRLAMLKLAIKNNPHFSISRADIDREGPHYSADTVSIIREQYPDAELYFVMGGDNLRSLPTWKRAQDLYRCCRLAVMKRADENIAPAMHDHVLPGLSQQVDIVDVPMLSMWLSSTFVAERLRAGLSVRYLVPDEVLDYIDNYDLYR
ncbi:MAG: nicotinate-nucleotide adenylyltransferase [Chloroflexota bacterium]|nr:nicotinate-nucleotide adenylyltransferase [Chloroflexota bacterium]MDE2858581.1 nicotinate-nucleotide adenylyltransferase [Chloroflexota bacterium]MDE2949515.1 nicotinate-nucleotide adenylyltransferase [Chloroflexota bacterium]